MAQETNTYVVSPCADKDRVTHPTFLPSSEPKALLLHSGLIAHPICAFNLMQFWASRAVENCGKIIRSIFSSYSPLYMSYEGKR